MDRQASLNPPPQPRAVPPSDTQVHYSAPGWQVEPSVSAGNHGMSATACWIAAATSFAWRAPPGGRGPRFTKNRNGCPKTIRLPGRTNRRYHPSGSPRYSESSVSVRSVPSVSPPVSTSPTQQEPSSHRRPFPSSSRGHSDHLRRRPSDSPLFGLECATVPRRRPSSHT